MLVVTIWISIPMDIEIFENGRNTRYSEMMHMSNIPNITIAPKLIFNMLGKFLVQIGLLQADTIADRYLATLLQRPEEIPTGA